MKKTLDNYIRGYPFVQVLLIASFSYNGDNYYLTKEECRDTFYYMKNDEVIDAKRIPIDHYPELSIKLINDRHNEEIKKEIRECLSYKTFVRFIKEQTSQDFIV